ncbi:Xaa-Pro dipeptidase [Marinobacter nanhaiticus D15-8W]|uniref:Xaa-Pro dipeptidase n=1 Tax=Marinobacter nanhaiticus D15-8W TaxID=626887 RepID=N6WXL2_9GAMM|nr:Xaa-Pro dipeptidase [Marinobacter nanhaiticus]ENO15797.1 Xaa-Pro dipeptidase [Marinobacter nanhaiticus D15-8W]BES73345.1 Xaa-Pro dipeptidase [Marinobacter nanhaiticus D15-8W]
MPDTQLDDLQKAHIQHLQDAYADILQQQGYDAVLISSGAAPVRYADDQYHHHHGYGHFLHWTGLTGIEHSWLLVDREGHVRLWLHTPVDFWHATAEIPTEAWTQLIKVEGQAGTGAPEIAYPERLAVIGDPAQINAVKGQANPPALLAALDHLRICKSDYEVECIERANARAARGHGAAREAFLNGASEFGINLAYQQATAQREVDSPYHSIIGLNDHAGILHYQHYETASPARARSLLIDAGCRYRGYCSDITRSTAAPGENRFQALINGVESLQQRLCDAVAPGVDYVELHYRTHLGIAALLRAADLVKELSEEDMVERQITRAFFPHGLGHFLGVQVHDVAGKPRPSPEKAPALRLTHRLEPGMVVTIEPGLYFIPSLLQPILDGADSQYLNKPLIDELKGCGGIRIEDNVLVTDTGSRNLTRPYLPE